MNSQFKIPLLAALFISLTNFGFAQNTTAGSGGDIQGSGGSASYTVGQTIYTTTTGSGGTAVQGVQNPIIDVVDGIKKAKDIQLEMAVYPNPTINLLTLRVQNYNSDFLSYQLFDVNGKVIISQSIRNEETTISLEYLATATYFLKVFDNEQPIKTFSIIKQ